MRVYFFCYIVTSEDEFYLQKRFIISPVDNVKEGIPSCERRNRGYCKEKCNSTA